MRSAESTLASSESKNNKSKVDQVWLSLSSSHPSLSLSLNLSLCPSPPKSYQCSLCSRRFRSVQALGGHQNAHRKEKNAMHKMYMDLLRNIKQQQEQPPPVHSPSAHASSSLPNIPPVQVPDHDHRQPEIDLDLGLSCGPSPPKFKYYEFI